MDFNSQGHNVFVHHNCLVP